MLLADAFPGERPATRARQITAFDLLGRAQAYTLGYTTAKDTFVTALTRRAVALHSRRYRRVIALPPRSMLLGSLDKLFDFVDESDIDPGPNASSGWFGRRHGNATTVIRHEPGDDFASSEFATTRTAVVQLPEATGFDALPAFVAQAYARHYQPGRAKTYRFDFFSNGVRFDEIARALYAGALAAGQAFDDPGDVYADPSFFDWLRARDGRASRYLRGYIAHHDLPEAPADDPAIDPAWLLETGAASPARQFVAPTFGVNVAGYFRAEVGIGEAGRSMARAVTLTGEPIALFDLSDLTFSRTEDRTFANLRSAAPHPITLLCINPPQYAALKARAATDLFRDGTYRIGTWWWELPDLPAGWHDAFADIHELWVGSRFILDTIKPVSPVPVFYVPPIVDPVLLPPTDRSEFDLDSTATVFLAMFDYNSVAERKNPRAVIDAFQRAFRHNERVRLVMKTINADTSAVAARELEAAAAGDERVSFFNRYLDRFGINRLFAACDAFISLHRSEGFGLGIAEAMAHGIPVVVTAWSGNMDFTTLQNSYLVDFELVTLETDFGPYFAGSTWAQPDVDHAAEQLTRIYHDRRESQLRGSRARYDIRSRYAPAKVAAFARLQLDRIATTVLQKAVTIP